MPDKHIVLGILAHVDAGKTTLSEAILYKTGAIRKIGRVDHKDAFLDGDSIERSRGITVFSKEARFDMGSRKAVLVDTPGHADFSAEMERTLGILDCAVLVVSGTDGVQSHTVTLWNLLKARKVPVFVFINKTDQPAADQERVIKELSERFGAGFVKFEGAVPQNSEEAAMCSEALMEEYLSCGRLDDETIRRAVAERTMFPVCAGSALKLDGVEQLLKTIDTYAGQHEYGDEFAAKVFKISRDKQGYRQTHMKITGGALRPKTVLNTAGRTETTAAGRAESPFGQTGYGQPATAEALEKTEQIRLYSGDSFETVNYAEAGEICTVTGLSRTYAGQALGAEKEEHFCTIEPTLVYRMILPAGVDPAQAMQKLIQLKEEDPALDIMWKEELQEIHVKVMGKLELEILRKIIENRFGLSVDFGEGKVIYKETIAEPVVGIGHFEPLRHYAEVHILMEPLSPGSGLVFESSVSEDVLDKNRQKLILSHLAERSHPGVITGAPVTDIKFTLIAGRDHVKHTEGGDFRQATYRAVRQGLRKGNCVLLEPMCRFRAEVPVENTGRLMTDLQKAGADFGPPETAGEKLSVIEGRGPASKLQDYQHEVTAYTKGVGSFSAVFDGYGPCPEQQRIADETGYDPDADLLNPTGSVFCSGGAATYVSWDKVDEAAHIRPGEISRQAGETEPQQTSSKPAPELRAGAEELEAIFLRTYGKSKRDEALRRERLSAGNKRPARPLETELPKVIKKGQVKAGTHVIIDGYNVIFAWDELKELAATNLDAAREALLEVLQNYGSYKGLRITAVFDGYRVRGNTGTVVKYGEVEAVYTKEAETADRYIEEKVYGMSRTMDVRVVTSDKAVQMAALGDGALRMSAREFYNEVAETSEEIREKLKRLR